MRTLVVAVLILFGTLPSKVFACNVCHSKNPKMVKMHSALGYKDCFVCHGPLSKRTMNDIKKEMRSDSLCSPCHAGRA